MTTVTISTPLNVREPRAAVLVGRLAAHVAAWVRATAAHAPLMVHGVNPHASAPAPTSANAAEVR